MADYYEEWKIEGFKGRTLIYLGEACWIAEDFESAKSYLKEGLERMKHVNKYCRDPRAEDFEFCLGCKGIEGHGYDLLGLCFKATGDKNLAKEYLERAYEIFKSIEDEEGAQTVLEELSSLEK
ncbi:MAG: hypothetical protein ACP5PA_07365 [Elusimicrobiales bacterium]